MGRGGGLPPTGLIWVRRFPSPHLPSGLGGLQGLLGGWLPGRGWGGLGVSLPEDGPPGATG